MTKHINTPEFWFDYFANNIKSESERASVILASSMIEEALESVLRNTFVQISSDSDPLFDEPYSPLSSFSAKIDIAYRISLLPPNYSKALHLLRKIRNDFAHNVTECSFENSSIRSRVLEFTKSIGAAQWVSEQIRSNFPVGPVGDFHITCSWLIWKLWSIAEKAKSIPAQPEHWPPPWEKEDGGLTRRSS